ncbi:MBL fold metallo-hydrolase [Qipengyuania sp. 1NDH17]|uniref:MBL fold metallo-hydrolase n=1 Tax=Qipengyuania polymorpha TaxID=2867234 RepID=A0ABS7J1V9_9SPHN|nr:MBL fold metallo-hydrolase [Qipengyuania polymorpha]
MAELTIFDVQHGSCALFTADTGRTILVDCGTNGKSGWTPTIELQRRGIKTLDMLVITNYDEDHANGLPELRNSGISISSLWRSKNVTTDEICRLKSDDGMGPGIRELVSMADQYTGEYKPVDYGALEREMYYNPSGSFGDENNMSAVTLFKVHGVKFVFPGDMERAGFDLIMKRSEFRNSVNDCGVLLAPHHGREGSVHPEFLKCANPYWTVISDCELKHLTQETQSAYYNASRGAVFRDRERKVLTTREDGDITFNISSGGWSAS